MNKLGVIFLGFFLIFSFLTANFSYAESPLSSDLQSLIRDLQAQIQALQFQVRTLEQELGKGPDVSSPPTAAIPSASQISTATVPSVAPTPVQSATEISQSQPESSPPELARSLSKGSSGDDVRKLQEFLAKDKEIYPEGLITGFFGPKTEIAVKKWQEKQGIEGVGIVGPKTIARFKDIGRGVIQGLFPQGAGQSNIIPPGLLKKAETSTLATPSGTIPAQPIGQTGTTTVPAIPPIQTATSISTTTPSGTIPAVPAQPVAGGATVPAIPAQPATQTVTDTTAPVVSNIQASNFTSTSLTITWTTNEASDSQVEYGPTWTYGSSTALNTSLVISHSVPLSGLIPSTSYQIKVKSKDAAGNLGTWTLSVATSATTTSIVSDTTAPSVPTNLIANTVSVTQINLSWTASTDNVAVSGYQIYRGGSSIATLNKSYLDIYGTSYIDTHLTGASAYSYTVDAYDQAGNVSNQSVSVSVTMAPGFSHVCGLPINVPQDTPSIQAALTAACSGDTIYVGSGTYTENLTVGKANLTLKGALGTTPDSVIIDGGGLNTVVNVQQISSFTIDGMTLQNAKQDGSWPAGAGLSINPIWSGTFMAKNLIAKNNSHGIAVKNFSSGTATLDHNVIVNNLSDGINGDNIGSSQLIITNNTIAYNGSGYSDWAGGGSRTFKNNIIVKNSRYGAYFNQNSGRTISYNDTWSNTNGNYYYGDTYSNPFSFVPSPGTGELSVDPKFVSSSDYHIQSTSPVINAGDPSINDPDGSRSDMGAYPFTGTITATDTISPSMPTNLVVAATNSISVSLQWTASTDNIGVIGYKIYRGGPNSTLVLYDSTTGTSYITSTGLTPSTTYTFTVAAYDAAGNVSAQSSSVSATTLSADTTAPIISNIQATNITATSAIITWATNESSDSQVEYGLATSYGSATTLNASSVTSHSVLLSSLQSNTTYHYGVKSKDAAGNLATSGDYAFTTIVLVAMVSTPTLTEANFGSGGSAPSYEGTYGMSARFAYSGTLSDVQSFRFYHKRAGEASFSLVSTFTNPSGVSPESVSIGTCSARISSNGWSLDYCPSTSGGFWSIDGTYASPASFPVGEYNSYVTAVDASGNESQASATGRHIVLDRTTVSSPTQGQITSLTPTFRWNIASGWPSTPYYWLVFYDSTHTVWTSSVPVTLGSTAGSKVYDGTALDPTKIYNILIRASMATSDRKVSYMSMHAGVTTFNISSSVSSLESNTELAAILKSLSKTIAKLQQALK